MSISVGKLVFLIVPGFLYVDSNLLMDEPPLGGSVILDTQLQTTRPPHRIFFIESGNRVERVVDDEFLPISPPLMNPGFSPIGFGGRETSVAQNHTSPMDHASRGFNANNKGDGSNSLDSSDSEEFPSLLLTPQRFFHIKVGIPKAHYITRLYPGPNGDVDIVEIKSVEPFSPMNTERGINMNMDMKLAPPIKSSLSTYNDPSMLSFTNQPPPQASGWSNAPISPIPTNIGQNSPIDDTVSPYGGNFWYSSRNVGQYNPQSSVLSNFNRASSDFGTNSQYSSAIRSPTASAREVDNSAQDYPPLIGPQQFQGTKTVPQPFGPNSQYGSPNRSPTVSERGMDIRGQDNPSQNGAQQFQEARVVPEPFGPNAQHGIPSRTPLAAEKGLDIRDQDYQPRNEQLPFQGAQSAPQPSIATSQYGSPNHSPAASEREIDYHVQDYSSQNGQQPIRGSQKVPQSTQGSQSSPQPLQGVQNLQQSFQGSKSSSTQFQGLRSRPQSLQDVQNIPQSFQGEPSVPQSFQGSQSSSQPSQGIQSSAQSFQWSHNGPQLSQGGHQISQYPNPSSSAGTYDQYGGISMPSRSLFTSRFVRPLLPSNFNNPDVRKTVQPNVQTLLKAVRSLDDGSDS